MRKQKSFGLACALLTAIAMGRSVQAADGDQYLGAWSGTYEGGNTSGHFQLTLERGADGTLIGSISVSGDDGSADYSAKLRKVSFVGDNFTAAYDLPGDGQAQVGMKGVFTASGADGDWSLGAMDQPASPAATGTWKIAKPKS